MSADPAKDTNALLLQLVAGGNSAIRSVNDLPSAAFTPSPGIFPVNILFSLSLTFAIICSFLAVLGEQWLVYYRKRSGGGAEYQRWEQLRRYLGAQRWHLEAILDDILPALLQLALVIFCVAFVVYLRTLSESICYTIATPMAIAALIILLMAIAASWDQWCPFKSPLSHFFLLTGRFIEKYRQFKYLMLVLLFIPYRVSVLVAYTILRARQLIRWGERFVAGRLGNGFQAPLELKTPWQGLWWMAKRMVDQACSPRVGETTAYLRAVAAKRLLCASEEFNALIYTGINIQAITEQESATCLVDDDAVHERLDALSRSHEDTLASVFSRVFPHLLLGSGSTEFFVDHCHRSLYSEKALYPKKNQYIEEIHPLKQRVKGIRYRLDASSKSLQECQSDGLDLLFYFELLDLLLDESSDLQDFSKWSTHFVEKHPASKLTSLIVIRFVARTVCIIHTWMEPASVLLEPGRWSRRINTPIGHGEQQQREDPEELRERYLTVQQQRVEAFKRVVDSAGWEAQFGMAG